MKKVLIFLSLTMSWLNWSQTSPIQDIKMSPNGYFDTVLDRFGNQYQLKDLQITDEIYTKTAAISCDSGIFELHYETGCGMEDPSNVVHNARRAVICRVFKDLSDFINTPLKNAGNTTKVKIWVRNPNSLNPPMTSNALGMATSFYTMPYNTAANFGGIIDGEVFKTIQGGKDSYVNVAAPLVNSDGSLNSSGNYYHGMMAFNFNLPSPKTWNTNLLASTITSDQYDLYSVVLHEVTHALGFNSLLNYDGNSVFGTGYKYYTRYDRFLKNNATSQFVLTTAETCTTMYNYGLSVSEAQLHPGCGLTPPVSNTSSNLTTCGSALKFFGTSSVPIYTPNCFEPGSSYSHFEDMCITPANNDGYFVMSNAQNTGVIKRFLKPEERNALQDIGYSLSMTYGNNSVVANSNTSYSAPTLTALDVAGINDGISSNGTYTFVGNTGVTIPITGILGNDYNATSFECVRDIFDSTANISISGTTINFSSAVAGLHLLRYVPVNTANKKGNITYVYVYLQPINDCGIPTVPTSCNLVINGDFEQFSDLPSGWGGSSGNYNYKACNWYPANSGSPDYLHVNAQPPNGYLVSIPCNSFGYENCNNSQGLAYAGMGVSIALNTFWFTEPLMTKLASPLQANQNYSLTFDVSCAEISNKSIKFQAFLTKNALPITGYSNELNIPSSEMNMLSTYPTSTTIKDGWEKISFVIPSRDQAGEEYLYIGGLKNLSFADDLINQGGCSGNLNSPILAMYYLDNVKLIPLNGASFDLPAQVCNSVTLSNLTTFLTATPTNGVFSGTGVANTSGTYSFNATTAGVGTHTIIYTYTNSSGCQVSISDSIQVVNTNIIVPTFNQMAPICAVSNLQSLPTTSINNITGTWSPALNNQVTTTYTFTPNSSQCTSPTLTTMTITVLPASDPSCSGNVCQNAYTLSTPESNASITYRALNTIESNTNYQVASGKQVTMKCENSISFKPGTYLNNGSTVWAKIQPCSDLSKIETTSTSPVKDSKSNDLKNEVDEASVITLFPNPSDSMITIQTNNSKELYINIYTLDGKLIYQNRVNQTSVDIDISSFNQGMYLVDIKSDSTLKKMKFIKN